MVLLLKILACLAAIVSVLMVVAIFSKNKYILTREISINRSPNDVAEFLRYNRNQKLYSAWLSFDPSTKLTYSGQADGSAGAILSFESTHKKTGSGEWELKKIDGNRQIDFEIRFKAPFPFTATGSYVINATDENQCRLQMMFNGGMKWPMNAALLFMNMDNVVGPDMATSLQNIKSIFEKN